MDKKYAGFIIAAGVVVLGLLIYIMIGGTHSSMNQNSTAHVSTADAVQTNNVDIQDYAYSPAAITVKKGAKVTWTNQDSVGHTVTSIDGTPEKIDSKNFKKGESFSFTFNKTGTYEYYCQPHPYMKGVVVVTD